MSSAEITRLVSQEQYNAAMRLLTEMQAQAIADKSTFKVALTGRARSGKSWFAEYIELYYDATELAFADTLKTVARTLYPAQFADGHKPRALLQSLGEHICAYDPQAFIAPILAEAANQPRVIVSDLRKQPEFDALKAAGFTVIRVNASAKTRLKRAQAAGDSFTASDMEHATETQVDGFEVDFEVDNDGLFANAEDQVDAIMAQLGARKRRLADG